MKPRKAMPSSSQNANQHKVELLNQAKRGKPGARKKLRKMGLLYWEHQGKVVVRRLWEPSSEDSRPIWWSFSRNSRYPI